MKILYIIALSPTVMGFSPTPRAVHAPTALSMSIVDDWKTFFSRSEISHRKEEHEHKLQETYAAQKEILERRRNPKMMEAYHSQEVSRHAKLDHQHDVDIENEIAKEWTPDRHPLTKRPYEKKDHSVFDDWKNFFSKPEMDHRRMQHHLDLMDTASAEQEILERRRDPAKMKRYHQGEEKRHQRLDKKHDVEVGFDFAEEKVLEEGNSFMDKVLKNFAIKK